MRWIVAYDISSDALRERIAGVLGRFGWRVQESVFECVLEDVDLRAAIESVSRELTGATDAEVRFYQTCGLCRTKSFRIGKRGKTATGGRTHDRVRPDQRHRFPRAVRSDGHRRPHA